METALAIYHAKLDIGPNIPHRLFWQLLSHFFCGRMQVCNGTRVKLATEAGAGIIRNERQICWNRWQVCVGMTGRFHWNIHLGLLGIITTTWFEGYRQPQRLFQPPGMMNRGEMKDMMQRMMPRILPPGIKPENLPEPESRGAKLLPHYCNQCHNLPSPKMHTAEEWPAITDRMFARMSMMSGMMIGIKYPSSEEQLLMISYLKTYSLKSVPPGMLSSPESKGAILFKVICSQRHALPDPKLHSPEEWPKVIERMMSNMQSMGRRTLTADERKVITNYLSAHKQDRQ